MQLKSAITDIAFGTDILDIEVPEILTKKFKTGLSYVDGAIGGEGGRGVAGAGAGDHLHAARLGFGDGHGHAAILERRRGIEPLVFQI